MKISTSERYIIPIVCLVLVIMLMVCFTYIAYAAEIGENSNGTTEVIARIEPASDGESSTNQNSIIESSDDDSTVVTGENPNTILYIIFFIIISAVFIFIISVYPSAKHKSE